MVVIAIEKPLTFVVGGLIAWALLRPRTPRVQVRVPRPRKKKVTKSRK